MGKKYTPGRKIGNTPLAIEMGDPGMFTHLQLFMFLRSPVAHKSACPVEFRVADLLPRIYPPLEDSTGALSGNG